MVSPQQLRRLPLFAGVDCGLLKSLAMAGEEIVVPRGEWLFHEGEKADALYIILEGRIDIRIRMGLRDIAPPNLTTLREGEILGWSALVRPFVYTMGAIANSDTRLVRMDGVRLCELMEQHPEMGFSLMRRLSQVLGERLTNLRTRFVSLIDGERAQSFSRVQPETVDGKEDVAVSNN
jgi:CRP-like cAMP-binding protein